MNDHDYLAHYGIKGQQWGKRNGPPYPLDYNDHSKAEKQKNSKMFISAGDEKKETNDDIAREVLKKNPNAAVVNPSLKDWAKAHQKGLKIAGGIALIAGGTVAGVYIAKHRNDLVSNIKVPEINNNPIVDKVLKDTTEIKVIDDKYGGFNTNEERFIAQWFKADMHRFDKITEQEFKSMPNEGVVLEAGEKMYRMSKSEHSTLRDGIEYVSFGEDRERYKGFLPQMWNANGAGRHVFFETELTALTKIKAPGKKESIEMLESVIKKIKPDASDATIRKYVFANFYKMQLELIDRNNKLAKLYLQEARNRGYNAVVDWNDAGRLADAPLILLNGAKQARVDKVQLYNLKQTREVFKDIKLPSVASNFTIDDWKHEDLAFLYAGAIAKFVV